jgi:hypothetical protein
MRSLTVLAAAALVMTVTVVPGAQAPTSRKALRRAGPPKECRHVHQGRGADSSALVPELPSAGLERPDVADHL